MGSVFSSLGGNTELSAIENSAIATIRDQIQLPFSNAIIQTNVQVVMTHGLGSKNPKVKSHTTDSWLNEVLIPGARKGTHKTMCNCNSAI